MSLQSLAVAGSAASGAMDFGLGNLLGFVNFMKNYETATRVRLAGRNLSDEFSAWRGGDEHAFDKPLDPETFQVRQAMTRDLLPGGVGDKVAPWLFPANHPSADAGGGGQYAQTRQMQQTLSPMTGGQG